MNTMISLMTYMTSGSMRLVMSLLTLNLIGMYICMIVIILLNESNLGVLCISFTCGTKQNHNKILSLILNVLHVNWLLKISNRCFGIASTLKNYGQISTTGYLVYMSMIFLFVDRVSCYLYSMISINVSLFNVLTLIYTLTKRIIYNSKDCVCIHFHQAGNANKRVTPTERSQPSSCSTQSSSHFRRKTLSSASQYRWPFGRSCT